MREACQLEHDFVSKKWSESGYTKGKYSQRCLEAFRAARGPNESLVRLMATEQWSTTPQVPGAMKRLLNPADEQAQDNLSLACICVKSVRDRWNKDVTEPVLLALEEPAREAEQRQIKNKARAYFKATATRCLKELLGQKKRKTLT